MSETNKNPEPATPNEQTTDASEEKEVRMPTCGASHNHCGGLCDRRENHPDAGHHCGLCGQWF